MRPILYNANETAFETYGLGEIDATKAQVTRERNGNYTLYIEYPASGPLAGTFKNDMRIKSDAGLRTKNQTFFISRILKDSTGILKVYAKHISHLTEKMAIRNNTNVSGTAQAALAIWALNALGGIRFDTWSDIDLTSKTSWNIADFKTARDVLGGVKGSILDVWGGEYEFDNTVIRLHKQLGRRSPIVLEYGRNILRAEDDQDIDGAYTSVYPYATYTPESQGTGEGGATSQQVTVELPEKYVDGPYIGLYNERRVLIVDFSSNFKDKEVPTIDKLRRLAKEYAINNRLGLPKINTKIEYVDLSKTLDYKLTQILEEAELCDIVPVYYPQIGLTSEDAKLTTIVYDVLLEQNDSVEVGVIGDGFKSSMTSNLSGKIDDLASNQQRLVNTLPDYLLNAQGNKVWYNRPDNSEHKVGDIWFEKNGLYDRMYVWNGSQWEKRIDTEDVDKIKKEVDNQLEQAKTNTDQAIAEATAKAQEALTKAGTIPDTSKLSDQIKQQILSSTDLNQKVIETLNHTDGGVIYNKILQNVKNDFVEQKDIGPVLAGINQNIRNQTVEFNKLTESNKLYERILGTSETGAPDKLSRLVMSSQIFQTEVGKYSTSGGPNMLRNSRADDGLKYWTEANRRLSYKTHQFYLNGQKRMFQLSSGSFVQSPRFIVKQNTNYMLNLIAFDANTSRFRIVFYKRRKGSTDDYDEMQVIFDQNGSPAFDSTRAVKKSFSFNTGDFDEGYLGFSYNGNSGGWSGLFMTELDFYEGSSDRKWQPAPEDSAEPIEAVRTQVTQLAGSYAIKNLNSAGDIISGINLGADGNNRFIGKLTHITGETQIDNAVIKSAMVDKLKTGNFESGSVTTQILASNAVTADKLLVDSAMINKLVSNQAFIRELMAQKAFITQLASIDISANRFTGERIQSSDGSLVFDLVENQLTMSNNSAAIVREDKGYPTHFIRYESSIEQNQKHSRTIIGSNRDGSKNWNSVTFAGVVIDNNLNNEVDKIFQYGDYNNMRHASSDDGWNFGVVSQTLTPGIWNKNSEIWCRHFVIPKKTKSDTDSPTEFIRLDESVAALWKLWGHALGQINMTGAMKAKVQSMLDTFSYNRDHII